MVDSFFLLLCVDFLTIIWDCKYCRDEKRSGSATPVAVSLLFFLQFLPYIFPIKSNNYYLPDAYVVGSDYTSILGAIFMESWALWRVIRRDFSEWKGICLAILIAQTLLYI